MRGIRRLLTAAAAAGALAAAPAGANGQACAIAPGTAITAGAGLAGYDLGSGISGPAWGADVAVRAMPQWAGGVEARIGYQWVEPGDGPPAHLIRQQSALAVPLPVARLTLCPTIHAGASLLALDGDRFAVWAGGPGLRLAVADVALGRARAVPFVEVRGLVGHSTGQVYGLPAGETGLALGAEAGVQAVVGRFVLRAAAAMDGFDDGLGITPYPARSGELSLGVRF